MIWLNTGRAEVAMTFKKADGTQYDVDGKLYDQVDIRMVIDGFNAPLTGGNFIDLIDKVTTLKAIYAVILHILSIFWNLTIRMIQPCHLKLSTTPFLLSFTRVTSYQKMECYT